MKIAILGFGKQGKSAYEYWDHGDNEITICDSSIVEVPKGAKTNFETDYLDDLHVYDIIMRSPIIHPRDILASNTEHPEVMEKVTSSTNEFFKVCPTKNIIGVTGTKGKGTTSTLITKILEAAGHKVHLGGNIGTPPLELLKDKIKREDWVVLELANFQLIDLKYSPKVAVCLMIVPEHLDWHKDMLEYIRAKQQLFVHQTSTDLAVFNASNLYSEEVADVSPAHRLSYEVPDIGEDPFNLGGAYVKGDHIYFEGKKVCDVDDVALLGRHNLENVCAAVAATWHIVASTSNKPADIIKNVVRSFVGLPHRIEIVKQVKGVWFINDSYAVNPSATLAAMKAIEHPQILVIGGFDRGLDMQELVDAIKSSDRVKKVMLIGDSSKRVANIFKQSGYKNFVSSGAKTMKAIVSESFALARKNDAVIFSPAFASFDMFKNFEDRGLQFKAEVNSL